MADVRFGTNTDHGLNEARNLVAHKVASLPAGAEAQVIYHNGRLKIRDAAGNWIDPTARANHTGNQPASTVSDLHATVTGYRLDEFAPPTAPVNAGAQRITNAAAGSAAGDLATYGQLQDAVAAAAAGVSFKAAVRLATTGPVTRSGLAAVDGITPNADDRVLVKAQADPVENGIYLAKAGAWARSADADSPGDLRAGAVVAVEEGATNGDRLYLLTTNGSITPGETGQAWAVYGTGSDGFTLAGAGLLAVGADTIAVGAGRGIVVTADAVAVDTAVVARKVIADVSPTAAGGVGIRHGLGNQFVDVSVYDISATIPTLVLVGVDLTDADNVALSFGAAGTYRVVVVG
ncbi:hypothetical protein [Amycolatopsis circi]|uniref:hypothetical protein n=1 Tax=Amycolatopsis circi TaxID=871959 RepID=UPI000E27AB69|nr:hypothetical protein [Amycolatopsis circi]